MAVTFEAKICVNENRTWFIELKDAVDGRVMLCNSLEELETNIEKLGEDYGGHIDEVVWTKDDNVPPYTMDQIRLEMSKHQEEMEKQKAESNQ